MRLERKLSILDAMVLDYHKHMHLSLCDRMNQAAQSAEDAFTHVVLN